jgi:2'-5' RNA ligase
MAKERLKSPRVRLFVALDLPDAVRDGIVAWQRGLPDPPLRPVRAESLHMTLVFLGHQPEKRLGEIAEAALGVEAEAPEVELRPEPVGVPRGKRSRLFALDAPSDGVIGIQAEVEARLVAAGFHEPEKRAFWPHLTVARVRPESKGSQAPPDAKRRRRRGVPAPVEDPLPPLVGTPVRFRPTRLVLYRSHLKRAGAEYEPMAELELPTAARQGE